MKTVNASIKKVGCFDYKIILVYEDGSRNELPSVMSLRTAAMIQRLFRNHKHI